MRSIIISVATAAAILVAGPTLTPLVTGLLPDSVPVSLTIIVGALVPAIAAGTAFFFAIRRYGYPSTSKRFPTAHRTFALIVGHVTFSFCAVLYPLSAELVNHFGVFGARMADAFGTAVVMGAVSFWLVSLDNRTMNFGVTLKNRSRQSEGKLLIGVVFAACCVATVPIVATLTQQISWQKTEGTTELISLAAEQQLLAERIHRLSDSADPARNEILAESVARARTGEAQLESLVAVYAARHHLTTEERALLPSGQAMRTLHRDYLRLANQATTMEASSERDMVVTDMRAKINAFVPAMAAAISTLQTDIEVFHNNQQVGQLVKLFFGPIVFIGLTLGLFWPLLRLIEAQRYGLDLRRREAEAATMAKSQFLATMSHELRTPMNGVLGMLRLLLRTPLTTSQTEQATTALNSGNDLLTILNDILDVSKLESGQLVLEQVAFNPARMTREVVLLLANQAEVKGVNIKYAVHPRTPEWICGDPTRTRQILINLVGNAIKFTRNGDVRVKIRYSGSDVRGRIRVEVKDTGVGIARDAQTKIFERFSQADTTITRKFGGTGLGLSISRQLVELMGGEIGFKSTEGFGSTFWFDIPTRPVTAPAIETPPEPCRKAAELAKERGPLKLLAAEDQPVNQQIITAFVTAAGHKLIVVDNGDEAVKALRMQDFDAILMDIQMPVMDGIEATKAIRSLAGPRAHIPIIALTANAMQGDKDKYLAAGMTDYISKPVHPDKLEVILNRVLTNYYKDSEAIVGTDIKAAS